MDEFGIRCLSEKRDRVFREANRRCKADLRQGLDRTITSALDSLSALVGCPRHVRFDLPPPDATKHTLRVRARPANQQRTTATTTYHHRRCCRHHLRRGNSHRDRRNHPRIHLRCHHRRRVRRRSRHRHNLTDRYIGRNKVRQMHRKVGKDTMGELGAVIGDPPPPPPPPRP